ncbi:MAG: hypothetical protein JNK64_09935 [Myxococcales bacterium]|nr:hypothetical protein [Myxococcales bacterium]
MRRALLFASLAAACADPAPTPAIRDLRVTAPSGAVELVPVPAEGLAVAWAADVDGDVELALGLVPDRVGDPTIALGTVPATVGRLTWALPTPAPRAGTYRVHATAYGDGRPLIDASASAIVVMQGVEFDATALAFTGADLDRDVDVTATVGRPIDVALAATPAGASAPRYLLVTASIASDLAPIGRSFRWTGVAQDGTALPAGAYDVTIDVAPQARPGTRYQVGGLVVTWTP